MGNAGSVLIEANEIDFSLFAALTVSDGLLSVFGVTLHELSCWGVNVLFWFENVDDADWLANGAWFRF